MSQLLSEEKFVCRRIDKHHESAYFTFHKVDDALDGLLRDPTQRILNNRKLAVRMEKNGLLEENVSKCRGFD